jgi:hypothetical protein
MPSLVCPRELGREIQEDLRARTMARTTSLSISRRWSSRSFLNPTLRRASGGYRVAALRLPNGQDDATGRSSYP